MSIGSAFQDGDKHPKMVVVPGGEYRMASPDEEEDRFQREGPQHLEKIPKFAIGVFSVTKGEYREFATRTRRRTDSEAGVWAHDGDRRWRQIQGLTWEKPGFDQEEDHPVVCVSWDDASAYAQWLGCQTERNYRLPSEAEWEYVARAGTETPYHFGTKISKDKANYQWKSGATLGGTCRVGAYGKNDFGLYDVHGNVWEWAADRWRDSYDEDPLEQGSERSTEGWGNCSCVQDFSKYRHGAPTRHTRVTPVTQQRPCPCRVLRGGSWTNRPTHLRSASRLGFDSGYRAYNIGFRMACSL